MGGPEVLQVESIGPDHVPRTIEIGRERTGSQEVLGPAIVKKRQRKNRLGAVEYEDEPMPFDHGISRLPGQSGNFSLGRDVHAAAVGGIFPVVERTLYRITDKMSASKIRAKMTTKRIKCRHLAQRGPKGDQPFTGDVTRQRTVLQIARPAK